MLKASAYPWLKRIGVLLFGIMAPAFLGGPGCVPASYEAPPPTESYVSDYDYLSDYGEWLELPPYGLVWQPYVVEDWAPFQHGHWSWTDDGWAWISYEPFGWMVYHYGYWNYGPHVGWYWVPGTVWSPARVEWYTFGNYCGWAPLPPPGVYWPDPWDPYEVNVWVVVDFDNFTNEDIGRHRIVKPNREIIRRQTITRRPPTIRQVETVTKRVVPMVRIEKRRSDVRPDVIKNPPKANRPREVILKKMVLPEPDETKVKEHSSEIEREVLKPRKGPAPEKQQAPEKKSEDEQKKKIKRR